MELEHEHEHRTHWRLTASLVLATVVFGLLGWWGESADRSLTWVAYAIAYAAGLAFPIQETVAKLRRLSIDIDFLMILVALVAWALGHPIEGAALLVLFNAGHAIEEYATDRTRSALDELMKHLPTTVLRVKGDTTELVQVEELAVGDHVMFRPGDQVPVDVRLVSGESSFDLSAITGESVATRAAAGVDIPSGAVNREGAVVAEVMRPASESAYQKILRLVENAPARQSPAQVLSEKVGQRFTMVILGISAAAFLLWWLVAGYSASEALYRAMVVLVAGSPCAIVLSLPSAVMAAIASGARRGILFNGGIGLEGLARVKWAALDKTGTLSTGEPGVVHVEELGATEQDWAHAAALARMSSHPASHAVDCHMKDVRRQATGIRLQSVGEMAGRGMQATVDGVAVELGRDEKDLKLSAELEPLGRVVFRRGGEIKIRFFLSETARVGAREAAARLTELGVAPLILSGDRQPAVDRMAESVAIKDARGQLHPEDKWKVIRDLAANGGVVMVGDGINDVPALSAATVGVAMGIRGSAAALAQADVVLVKDRLTDLPEAVVLARRCQRIVKQNLAVAVGAAGIMLCFAAMGTLPLALGVFGHEGGTVLVLINSMRLLAGVSAPVLAKPVEQALPELAG